MKCPECNKEIQLKAVLPKRQTIIAKIELSEGFIGAHTLGGFTVNFAKALQASAKSIEAKVDVFVSDVRFAEKEIKIEFLVVDVKK